MGDELQKTRLARLRLRHDSSINLVAGLALPRFRSPIMNPVVPVYQVCAVCRLRSTYCCYLVSPRASLASLMAMRMAISMMRMIKRAVTP